MKNKLTSTLILLIILAAALIILTVPPTVKAALTPTISFCFCHQVAIWATATPKP